MALNKVPKSINTKDLNEVVSLGKKILHIFYIFLIVGAVLCCIIFCKSFGVFRFIGTLLKVLSPLFIGFVVAWLFNPLVLKLRRKGFNKYLAAMTIYAVFLIFLGIFIKVFIPVIYSQINDFVSMVPAILKNILNFVNNIFDKFSGSGIDFSTTKETVIMNLSKLGADITAELPNNVLNIIIKLFSGLGTFAMGLLIGLYMLFDFDGINNLIIKLIPKDHKKEIIKLLDNIGTEVRKAVNGTLLVACMVFLCDTVGFSIIGLDGALLFGLFCGITDLIPYIGPYIGAGVAAIIGFTQSPVIGLGVLIIALLVQLIENYVLQPIVMSNATQIHPIIIILGLLVFGHFFGIIGMILATPILSILKVIIHFIIDKYQEKRNRVSTVIEE